MSDELRTFSASLKEQDFVVNAKLLRDRIAQELAAAITDRLTITFAVTWDDPNKEAE